MIVCHIEAPATSHSRGLIYPIVFKYLYTDLMRDSHMLPYLGKHNWEDITKALAEVNYQGDFSLEIFNFTRNIPKEELPLALKRASRIAHYLIDWVEDYRNQKNAIKKTSRDWLVFLYSFMVTLSKKYRFP